MPNSPGVDTGVKKPVSFEAIVKELTKHGSAQGFRKLRNFLLSNYYRLKGEFTPLGLMQLVISCDKHAQMAEITNAKTKDDEQTRWALYQKYMAGEIDHFEPTPIEESDDGESESISVDGEGAGEGGVDEGAGG